MKTFLPRATLLALAVTLASSAPAAAQGPLSPVEGVWSFLGGRVAVERQEDGSFLGTVIRRTRVDVCRQEIGERLWIDMRLQDDGSYWGQHQFFRTGDECEVVPDRGNAAFRVINPAGQTYLRVCLARPDTPDVQPKISEFGESQDANAGCRDAALIGLLPTKEATLKDILKMPRGRCVARRRFGLGLKHPPGDAVTEAKVTLNGQKVRVVTRRGLPRALIDLRDLPRGSYRLRVVAETARGEIIKGTRRFRNCS